MDTNLRRRIRAGDHDAFGDLFDAYARSVHNHAYRLTGDWTTAEDAVSLTFLDAWRLRGRLDAEGGSLRPWLLGIATNVVRNTRRAARRHAAVVARTDDGERVELIFDKETKEFLGERQVAVEDLSWGFEKGEVTGRSAVFERTVVDERGERP